MTDPTVCHIPPVQPATQPQPGSLPSIPLAQPNLASLTATVNALRHALMVATGQQPNVVNGFNRTPDGSSNAKGTWTEQSRVTDKVKIYQNNDPTTGNFVEVEQINALTMRNRDTGQTWKWNK